MTGTPAGAEAASRATAAGPFDGPAIETHELRKQFGRIVALAGLTMTVRRGEVFGFLGPNGAGKTTAVKLLLGLSRPTGGEGRVLGSPMGDVATRRRIGYLPELFRYQSWMTAREVLALHCELARLDRVSWHGEIVAALALVGLADRSNDRVETFSKGMQQRLGLAVALLGRPELVVLDEPTSALDPVGRQDVREIIGSLRSRSVTVFLNSHLLTEVERVCDRVAIVDRGRVVAELGMAELLDEGGVRVRVSGLTGAASIAGRFGPTRVEGEWLAVDSITDQRVPALVSELVAHGGFVHAVVPARRTLEERFLSLLGAAPDVAPDVTPDVAPDGGPGGEAGVAVGRSSDPGARP
ncbi:MAG: ABC transporter ATP-binding protein [Candidatus Limnocylindrales bacterium]|jgi:ABC-2 type transport system ATP-binding protein